MAREPERAVEVAGRGGLLGGALAAIWVLSAKWHWSLFLLALGLITGLCVRLYFQRFPRRPSRSVKLEFGRGRLRVRGPKRRCIRLHEAELRIGAWGGTAEPTRGAVLELDDGEPLRIGGLDAFGLGTGGNMPPVDRVDLHVSRHEFAKLVPLLLEEHAKLMAKLRARRGDPYRAATTPGKSLLPLVSVVRALDKPAPEPAEVALVSERDRFLVWTLAFTFLPAAVVSWALPFGGASLACLYIVLLLIATFAVRGRKTHELHLTRERVELVDERQGIETSCARRELEVTPGQWARGPALELRFGWNASFVIATSVEHPHELEASERALKPDIRVDARSWWALRRGLEDFLT